MIDHELTSQVPFPSLMHVCGRRVWQTAGSVHAKATRAAEDLDVCLREMQCWPTVERWQGGFQHVLLQFLNLRLVLVGMLFRVLLAAAKLLYSQVSLPDMLI